MFTKVALLGALLGVPTHVSAARQLTVNLGPNIGLGQVIANGMRMLAAMSILLSTVLFLYGAFLFVISRGKEDLVGKGKDFMIGALIGMAVVIAAYGMVRTLYWFIYVAP